MSMSRYMHPRNIYKTPPNFKQLAKDFPEFRKFVKQELSGKVSIDFKDVAALKALTCTLLEKDFSLSIEIPPNKLIPTIPLRLNYVLWVEDLLEIAMKRDQIRGIDIGTGASCVYPLIGAKKNNWNMIGTEVDEISFKCAVENVARNNFNDLVTVKKVDGDTLLKEAIGSREFDFCMCNPPFFASQQETMFQFKSRKESRPRPRNAFCASQSEVVVHGGEVEFITKMINESKELQQKVSIYTTMVGHKVSLVPLKKLLREVDVMSFKQTEFCQGNTTRWGLAWTYCDIDLRKVPETTLVVARMQKIKNPVQFTLENPKDVAVQFVAEEIFDMFNKLEISFQEVKHTKNVMAYNITAQSNTWSHQRRKRRELQRLVGNNNDSSDADVSLVQNDSSVEHATDLISELNVRKSPNNKRELDEGDEEGYYKTKKIKLTPEAELLLDASGRSFLEAAIVMRKDVRGIHVELIWTSGSANRDALHQILQYIKNNLRLD